MSDGTKNGQPATRHELGDKMMEVARKFEENVLWATLSAHSYDNEPEQSAVFAMVRGPGCRRKAEALAKLVESGIVLLELQKYEAGKRMIQVWSEGYQATGERADAMLHGTYEAETLDEAVQKHIAGLSADQRKYWNKNPQTGNWFMWGCKVFDNETDARKSYG